MANTFKFGNGEWAVGKETVLAYNDENNNFKPLPFTFDRASTATVVNKDGLIETVGVDEPRIDYTGNTKGHLLLEPQRQNAITNSETFGSTGWSLYTIGTAIAPIVTDNYAISPDGTQNAQRVQFNLNGGTTTSDRTIIRQNIGLQTDWFLSVYMKSTNGQEQKILWHTTSDSNETIVTGEWQRFTFSRNAVSNAWFGLGLNGGFSSVDTADILVYGLQAEQGSYATSYIPTSGSAETRSAEIPFGREDMVDLNLYSSEMTWFYDINLFYREGGTTVAPRLISTSNSQVFIGVNTPQSPNTDLRIRHKDGTTALNTNEVTFTNGGRFKIAVKITGTTGTAYINGTNVGTFTTLAASNYDKYENVQNNPNNINDMRFYNTALSDAECEALTS